MKTKRKKQKNPNLEPKLGFYYLTSPPEYNTIIYISSNKRIYERMRKPFEMFVALHNDGKKYYDKFISDYNQKKFKLKKIDLNNDIRSYFYKELIKEIDPVGYRRLNMKVLN